MPETIDIEREMARMRAAARVRIGFEQQWYRDNGGGGLFGSGHNLDGPYGHMIMDEIMGRFASGPQPRVSKTRTNKEGHPLAVGYSVRWAQIAALSNLADSPLADMVRHLSLLYLRGLDIGGEIESPGLAFLKARADIDATMLRKQASKIGLQGIATRPTLEEWKGHTEPEEGARAQYYPPALTLVYPDQAIAIRDPGNPSRPKVFIEFDQSPQAIGGYVAPRNYQMREGVTVWDMTDPSWPKWGKWQSLGQWENCDDPLWAYDGVRYPWRWNSEPFMPVVCEQFDPKETELLPANESDLQGVLDLVLGAAWIDVVAHAGSFQKALLISEAELKGLRQSMADPNIIHNLFGGGNVNVEMIPDSTAAAERLRGMYDRRYLKWAKRFNSGFVAREEGGVQPDTATGAGLRLTDKFILRQRMEVQARPADTMSVQALSATLNYLNRSRQISLRMVNGRITWTPHLPPQPTMEMMIPEGEIELGYPAFFSQEEKSEFRESLQAAVDRAQESPRHLWLLDHDLEDDGPDGPNWELADVNLRRNLADAMAYGSLSYGSTWFRRNFALDKTPEDESTQYEPPADVANTASRGLSIRDETKLGPDGMTPVGKRLLKRSRKLGNQELFLGGEVRQLAAWLDAHAGDAGDETTAEGVTWLTQGGDAAVAWTDEILKGLTADAALAAPLEEGDPEDVTEPEGDV